MRSLSALSTRKRQLNQLCTAAVEQQAKQNKAENTHLRQRRRYLAKQVLKRVPLQQRDSNSHWLRAVTLMFAAWGFTGIVMPNTAQAAASFEHLMLEGFDVGGSASPTFADIDNDGDLDAFVGERQGAVKFYRNSSMEDSGSAATPRFVADVEGNPLAGINVGESSAPTFADIDNDGDLDAFVGEYYGTVVFYRNFSVEDGGAMAAPPRFVADAVGNPLAGIDVGANATPTFADIDKDGDLDAFVGARNGTVVFYRNFSMEDGGTAAAPRFVADAAGNPLAGIDVGVGAAPTFADIDDDGDLDAFVGVGNIAMVFYQNDGDEWAPNFVPVDGVTVINPLAGIDESNTDLSVPAFADIDDDGDLDAFIGDDDGTVKLFSNSSMEDSGTAEAPRFSAYTAGNPLAGFDVGGYASPAFTDIDDDGDLDAFVGESYGTVKFFQNDGSNLTPAFIAANGVDIINPLAGYDVGYNASPAFADIDDDGDLDAFVGEYYGTVAFYRNYSMEDGGTASAPRFVADAAGNPLAAVAGLDGYAKPTFADIDDDGDLDAFVGDYYGTVAFYRNYSMEDSGSAATPRFVADVAGNPLAGVAVADASAPTFADIDNDGDLDAFVGDSYGLITFYRNHSIEDSGTATAPRFIADEAGNPLAGFGVGSYNAPTFADIDSDGDLDAFVGEMMGSVRFFENLDDVNRAPTFDSTPTISGTATVGETLSLIDTATTDLDGDSVTLSYQWKANGTNIDGATFETYTLTANESDKSVTATITADDGNGGLVSVTTSGVTISAAANNAPTFDNTPAISSTPQVGSTLGVINTATTDLDGDSVTLSYQWKANGTNIDGATFEAYTLTANESGKSVTATITADDGNGGLVSVTTSGVTISAAANNAPTFDNTPAISGTPQVGSTLGVINTATTDVEGDNVTLSYRWQANGVDIAGATSATFALTANESGKPVTATITANDGNGGITNATTSGVTVTESANTGAGTGGGSLSWMVLLAGLFVPLRRFAKREEG